MGWDSVLASAVHGAAVPLLDQLTAAGGAPDGQQVPLSSIPWAAVCKSLQQVAHAGLSPSATALLGITPERCRARYAQLLAARGAAARARRLGRI